jgi:DNA repair photolyase
MVKIALSLSAPRNPGRRLTGGGRREKTMPLNKSSGNMYEFITHTWNPVRGECPFDCSYCFVKRWGTKQNPLHIDRTYLTDRLGKGRFIFICSGCDLFHPDVPWDWIADVRYHTLQYPGNQYLWHTKNPKRLVELIEPWPSDVACVTIESNIGYKKVSLAPMPFERAMYLREWKGRKMITVEPILKFSIGEFSDLILSCNPEQVNIGADSKNNKLPEPTAKEVKNLMRVLEKYTKVVPKDNLTRIMKGKE